MDLLLRSYDFVQSMVFVNQAIFEAREGYSRKVQDLEESIGKEGKKKIT